MATPEIPLRKAAFEAFQWLKSDGRRAETSAWERWFRALGRTRAAFADALDGDDPLPYNETAAMGALASAAASLGWLALAEYVCTKRGADKLSRRAHGRADLWVHDPNLGRSWSFEAKRVVCRAGVRIASLRSAMARASRDALRIGHWEADAVYGLVVILAPEGPPGVSFNANVADFAKECSFACRLGGGERSAYLFFHRVR